MPAEPFVYPGDDPTSLPRTRYACLFGESGIAINLKTFAYLYRQFKALQPTNAKSLYGFLMLV